MAQTLLSTKLFDVQYASPTERIVNTLANELLNAPNEIKITIEQLKEIVDAWKKPPPGTEKQTLDQLYG